MIIRENQVIPMNGYVFVKKAKEEPKQNYDSVWQKFATENSFVSTGEVLISSEKENSKIVKGIRIFFVEHEAKNVPVENTMSDYYMVPEEKIIAIIEKEEN